MGKNMKPISRLGNFEELRKKIVEEYAAGNYIKTSADLAMEEEQKRKQAKEIQEKGDNDGNSK